MNCKEMTEPLINIAYAADDRFAELTGVSMASVMENTTHEIVFYLFETRLSAEHKNRIKLLVEKYPKAKLEFRHILLDDETYITSEETKVTKETYVKALLPELLSELDRVIWLDGDTVVERDIYELWSVNAEDFNVCAVRDTIDVSTAKNEILGFSSTDTYFNTGVLLMNLTKLRKLKLFQLINENCACIHDRLIGAGCRWYAEQDMLNYLLRGTVKELPMKFNSFIWFIEIKGKPLSEYAEAISNPLIWHFLGSAKPNALTRQYYTNPVWDRYFHYKALTPYHSGDDEKRIELYRQYETNLFNGLYVPELYHFLTFVFRKQLFEIALKEAESTNKKIVIWGYNNQTALLLVFLHGNGILVESIIDGVYFDKDIKVLSFPVTHPDEFVKNCTDYFFLLDMRSKEVAEQIVEVLKADANSGECNYYHVYSPLYTGA